MVHIEQYKYLSKINLNWNIKNFTKIKVNFIFICLVDKNIKCDFYIYINKSYYLY